MSQFAIVTDSTTDFSKDMIEKLGLDVISQNYTIDGKEYADTVDNPALSVKDFYDMVRQGAKVSTSAVNTDTFLNRFEAHLEKGEDLLVIAFSSSLSSTCDSAMIAAGQMREKYPDRKIVVVDSLCASLGEGLYVYYAAKMRDEGKSIEAVEQWLLDNRLNLCHWFTVDDLNHLKRGGRVSAATAFVGTMLGIKPVLHVDDEGHLIAMSKARGRLASLKALVDKMEQTAINPQEQVVYISHGDALEDAQKVKQMVEERLHPKEVYINSIGPVIGSHAGPGTMALFFLGTER